MCKGAIFSLFQYLIPQHLLSRAVAKLANSENPKIKDYLILKFIRHFKVNLAEAERENPKDYKSFNDFFTRALKPSARIINAEPDILISPADGEISQVDRVSANGRILQAKGRDYNLIELLGGESKDILAFQNGYFSTIYLAPKDYHRVHMPMDGELLSMTYCPGQLFSVNPSTANHIPNLFARNERVVIIFQTSMGKMAVVLVGAMLVAGIETVFAGPISPSNHKNIHHFSYEKDTHIQKSFKRGEELGRFQFGSTVIVLHESRNFQFDSNIVSKSTVQMGQKIGKFS
jgi:phosphatidylserine decarboxylase